MPNRSSRQISTSLACLVMAWTFATAAYSQGRDHEREPDKDRKEVERLRESPTGRKTVADQNSETFHESEIKEIVAAGGARAGAAQNVWRILAAYERAGTFSASLAHWLTINMDRSETAPLVAKTLVLLYRDDSQEAHPHGHPAHGHSTCAEADASCENDAFTYEISCLADPQAGAAERGYERFTEQLRAANLVLATSQGGGAKQRARLVKELRETIPCRQ